MPNNPITAWSYSRLAVYRKCPRQFKYKFVDKLPEPKSPAMQRGTDVHLMLQNYVEGKTKKFPVMPPKADGTGGGPVSAEIRKLYDRLRKAKANCELEYATDSKWAPTSWFDRGTWTRAKLDVELHLPKEEAAEVIDTKTGKEDAGPHGEQLEIYAVIEWAHRPLLREVRAAMAYVDIGKVTWAVFTDPEKTVPRLRKKWETMARPVLKDRTYKATPSGECRWCPFSGRRGGPCDKG